MCLGRQALDKKTVQTMAELDLRFNSDEVEAFQDWYDNRLERLEKLVGRQTQAEDRLVKIEAKIDRLVEILQGQDQCED